MDAAHHAGLVERLAQQIEGALLEEFRPPPVVGQPGRHDHAGRRGHFPGRLEDFRQASGCPSPSQSTMGIRYSRKAASASASVRLGCSANRQFGYRVRLESRKVRSSAAWSFSTGLSHSTVIMPGVWRAVGSAIGPYLLPARKTTPRLARRATPACEGGKPIMIRAEACAPLAV